MVLEGSIFYDYNETTSLAVLWSQSVADTKEII